MPVSILVAHGSAEVRDRIEGTLYEAGYECIPVKDSTEALRSTVGLNPGVVIAHAGLKPISGYELPGRLRATGLRVPPFLILVDANDELPAELPPGDVYCVFTDGLDFSRLIQYLGLLMVARDIRGEFGETLDVMHGDLTRTPFGDLLQALQRHVFNGRLDFSRATPTGLWLAEGSVVDAWWGRVRGVKAFNRMAGMGSGGYSLRIAQADGPPTIDALVGDLIVDAVEERLAFDEAMAELPSMEARPQVNMTPELFTMEFTPVERKVLGRAQDARTLEALVDTIDLPDADIAQAAVRLVARGVLVLQEPADKVHVFTDSPCDLLPTEAASLGVNVVAVSILLGTDVYRDGVDLQPESFYRKLEGTTTLPITYPVSKGEFLAAYRRVVAYGAILGIYCSSMLSKSHANAVAAASEGREEFVQLRREAGVSADPAVHTVDSGQCSAPLGLLVTLAVRLLRAGSSLREVVARLEELRRHMRTVMVVPTLDYLARTGEVSKEKLAAMKKGDGVFILQLEDGELKVRDRRPPGPRTRARVLELLGDGRGRSLPSLGAIVHASAPAGRPRSARS